MCASVCVSTRLENFARAHFANAHLHPAKCIYTRIYMCVFTRVKGSIRLDARLMEKLLRERGNQYIYQILKIAAFV